MFKVVPGLDVARIELHGDFRLFDGLGNPAHPSQNSSQVIVGIGIGGLDAQGLLKLGDRFGHASRPRKDQGQVVADFGITRPERDDDLILPDGFGKLSGGGQRIGQAGARGPGARIVFKRVVPKGDFINEGARLGMGLKRHQRQQDGQ